MAADTTPRRLRNPEQVGTTSQVPLAMGLVFGAIFAALGLAGVLASMEVFGAAFEAGRNAPHWLFTVFGLFFMVIGFWVIWSHVRSAFSERARRLRATSQQGNAAMQDYPWNEAGFVANPWPKVFRNLAWSLVFVGFLVPFNYLMLEDAWPNVAAVFRDDAAGVVERVAGVVGAIGASGGTIIIAIFDLAALYVIGACVLAVVRAVKFGNGRLVWDRFPIAPGRDCELCFELPRTITWFERATVELRCIREFWEETQARGKTRRQLVHEQIWFDSRIAEGAEYDAVTRAINVRFFFPVEMLSSTISAAEPVFWRADLRVKMAGPAYVASFLVPVYADHGSDFPVANEGVRI